MAGAGWKLCLCAARGRRLRDTTHLMMVKEVCEYLARRVPQCSTVNSRHLTMPNNKAPASIPRGASSSSVAVILYLLYLVLYSTPSSRHHSSSNKRGNRGQPHRNLENDVARPKPRPVPYSSDQACASSQSHLGLLDRRLRDNPWRPTRTTSPRRACSLACQPCQLYQPHVLQPSMHAQQAQNSCTNLTPAPNVSAMSYKTFDFVPMLPGG